MEDIGYGVLFDAKKTFAGISAYAQLGAWQPKQSHTIDINYLTLKFLWCKLHFPDQKEMAHWIC